MGVFSQVYAIVWKDVYVQAIKRHYLVTTFEVAMIFLAFLGVERDRPQVAPPTPCAKPPCLRLSAPRDYPERNESDFRAPQLILYAPREPNEKLVKTAFPAGGRVRALGYDTEEDLLRAFYHFSPRPKRGPEQRVVALVFGDTRGKGKNDLEFTVRFFDDAHYITRRNKVFALFSTLPNPVTQRESVAYCQIALVRAKTELMRQAGGEETAARRAYRMTTRRFSEGPLPEDALSELWIMAVRIGVGYLVTFCTLVGRLAEEAQTGMREKLRLAGLHDAIYWLGHFMAAMFKGLVSIACIMGYMTMVEREENGRTTTFLEGTNKIVVFVSLVLFSFQYVTTAMVLSLFFANNTVAILFGMCYWITAYAAPWLALEDFDGLSAHYIMLTRSTKLTTSLLPCMALHWCYRIIGCANVVDEQYSLSSVSKYVLELDNVTMLEIWTVMVAYSALMCVAIWYLGNVLTWARGVPLAPWFPVSSSYWLPSRQGAFEKLPPAAQDGVHFEQYPPDKEEAVFVNRLEYEKEHTHVLRDTNFKAYPNELLVVIGPSGSGKSSLVRIVTGMQKPSGGQVIVEGFDVTSQTASARASMGVVLQRAVLFDDLTAYEHLLFFGRLGGLVDEALVHRAVVVTDMMLLTELASTLTFNMTTSAKRRLDLAIAILLNPRVLILDEPVFGMDIESRYKVREVLNNVKQKTCVVVTTSDIDDVGTLGDRVAILGHGGLKCFGTPAFLRWRYGCGYNLHVTKAPNFQTNRLVLALREASKDARLLQDHKRFAIMSLGEQQDYGPVSDALLIVERRQAEFAIQSYKVCVTTMADVFLRVVMEMDAGSLESKRRAAALNRSRQSSGTQGTGMTGTQMVEHTEGNMVMPTANVGGLTHEELDKYESSVEIAQHVHALNDLAAGMPRTGQIFLAMLFKRRQYMRQTLSTPLACWLLPSFLMFLVCRYEAGGQEQLALRFGADRLVYDLGRLQPHTDVLLARDSASSEVVWLDFVIMILALRQSAPSDHELPDVRPPQLADSFYRPYAHSKSLTVRTVPSMDKYMAKLKQDRSAPMDALAGAQFVAEDGGAANAAGGRAVVWYHGDAYHTQSASANLIGTALLRWASNDHTASMLSMLLPMRRHNYSIYSRTLRRYDVAEELHMVLSQRLMRFMLLPAAMSVTAASFVLFAIEDRVSKSKEMQLLSGVPPLVYWMGNYVWDMLMSLISLVCMFFPITLCFPQFISVAPAVISIFLAYVHSVLAFVYWFSFFMDSTLAGFILVNIITSLTGTVAGLTYQLSLIGNEKGSELLMLDPPRDLLLWLLYLLPPFSYTWALIKTMEKLSEEPYCIGDTIDVRDVCAYVHNSLDEGAVLLPNLRYCCANFYASNMTSVRLLPSFSFHRYLRAPYVAPLYQVYLPLCKPRYRPALPLCGPLRDGILTELLVMLAEGCVLLLLLALYEKGFFRSWDPGRVDEVVAASSTISAKDVPVDVATEARHVHKAIAAHDLNKPALLVLDLNKQLQSISVLRGLTFSVEPGEALAVVGLRGCGKSTLLDVLSGSTQPTSGTALIGDVPLQNRAEWEQRIGVCPSHDSVLGRLTVRQTLQLYANIRGIRPQDIDRLLEHLVLLLNLTQSVDETTESCGAVTRRKLAVAIAIIGLPSVVLMDDPATGLDLMSKRKIYRTVALLRHLVKSAVLIVTHSVSDCVVMSDRMAVMREGRFQCLGAVNELRERLSAGTVLLVRLALDSSGDAEVLKLVHMLVLKTFPDAKYNGWLGRSLEYAVTLSAPWSQLVLRVRDLHLQMVNNVTDVVLTDMTLELGLLKVVKYQKPKRASTPAEDVVV
nr:phospholipid-transporting ATPase ABCA3-like [Dermacentor andersoni]